MAFTTSLVARYEAGAGFIVEKHAWNGASVNNGTVTPDTSDAEGIGQISVIDFVSATDTTTNTAPAVKYTTGFAGVTLTFTANDVGHVTIVGKAT